MKCCPICRESPLWHFCRNTTRRAKDGTNYFMIEHTCRHSAAFSEQVGIVADSLRNLYEARWDVVAEKLFDMYTSNAGWNDVNRAAFRAAIFPPPKAVITSYVYNAPWRDR